jgi:hypothetical protein
MLESGRDEIIDDSESLARFAISKSQFSRVTNKPKPNLLSPNPHIELSVSRIDGLDKTVIQSIGDGVARSRNKSNSLGYAHLKALKIRTSGLDVFADEGPPHHANITGWSSEGDRTERKRLQLVKAKQLVEISSMQFY